MLELRGIDACYGMSQVLFDVNMDVQRGEAVCLLGRNGAGKTTTIKTIMGFVKVIKGEIIYKGESLNGLPTHLICQKGIGYVPEDRRIFRGLTVLENLIVGQNPKNRNKGRWDLEKIFSIFPVLRQLAHRKGGTLSGGEQQMLALARTLIGDPELLLLDEPSEGLAPLVVRAMRDQILSLKAEGITILLSEQNLKFAGAVGDKAYIMEKGQIKFQGPMREIEENEEIRRSYLAL